MARGPLLIDEKVSDFTFSDIRNPPTPWKQMLTLILEELVLESKEEQLDIDQRFSKTRHFKTTIFSLSFLFIDLLQIRLSVTDCRYKTMGLYPCTYRLYKIQKRS